MKEVLDFIQMYQYEILGVLALLLVILLIVIIKKKKSNIIVPDNEVIEDIYGTDDDNEYEENYDVIEEEESFTEDDNEETEVYEEKQEETDVKETPEKTKTIEDVKPKKQKNRQKRKLPSLLPQISNESFKDFKGLKILIAEDNAINQKVLSGMLDKSGIEVVFANDGVEAINILTNQKDFDLVLMDAHMPNLDGIDATVKIREKEEFDDLPIIALSGDVAKDDIKHMLASGMDYTLAKPVKMDELYKAFYIYSEDKNQQYDDIDTLDTELGLSLAGDEKFYKEIVKEFYDNYSDSYEKIVAYLKGKNFQGADKLLLDVSGICASIGAKELNENAINLKLSIKAKDLEGTKFNLKNYKNSLQKLKEKIKNYLSI